MRVASILRANLSLRLASWLQILPFQMILDNEVRFKFQIAVVSAFGDPIPDAEVTICPANAPETAIRWTRDLKLPAGRHRFSDAPDFGPLKVTSHLPRTGRDSLLACVYHRLGIGS